MMVGLKKHQSGLAEQLAGKLNNIGAGQRRLTRPCGGRVGLTGRYILACPQWRTATQSWACTPASELRSPIASQSDLLVPTVRRSL